MRFNPSDRTILTEIKAFAVDAVRKVSTFRITNSTKATDLDVRQVDVNVKDTYTIDNFSKVIGIACNRPFDLELTQGKEVATNASTSTTMELVVNNGDTSLIEGKPLIVSVKDDDLLSNSITARVTNVTTNESEVLGLQLVNDEYQGTLLTAKSLITGTSSNNALNVKAGDIVRVEVDDPTNEAGNFETIIKELTVIRQPNYTTKLAVNRDFLPGSQMIIKAYDPEATSISVNVLNTATNEQENVVLNSTSVTGYFAGVLNTVNKDSSTNTNPVSFDGSLDCFLGDNLQISYIDAVNNAGIQETVTKYVTVGSLNYSPSVFTHNATVLSGEPLQVTLTNTNTDAASLNIVVLNKTTHEIETVVLEQEYPLSNVYKGTLVTVNKDPDPSNTTSSWYGGSNEDGSMNVRTNDVLQLQFNNDYDVNGNSRSLIEQVTVVENTNTVTTPTITYEYETISIKTDGVFYLVGNMEHTSVKIVKPENETAEYLRCQVLAV